MTSTGTTTTDVNRAAELSSVAGVTKPKRQSAASRKAAQTAKTPAAKPAKLTAKPAAKTELTDAAKKRLIMSAYMTASADFATKTPLPAGVTRAEMIAVVAARASYMPTPDWDKRFPPRRNPK